MDEIERRWIERMKETLAIELSRGMTQGLPPKALIELLWGVPEMRQAMEMRARGRPKD